MMMKTTTLSSLTLVASLALVACGSDVNQAPSGGAGGDATSSSSGTGGAGGEGVSEPWHEACPKDAREQRLIDVGDVSLNVACRGSGPTVVFLHGFPEFHYSWDKVMDELAGEFRLVAPDQRGYNISDKPPEVADYLLPKLADDILKLLPLVSSEPVILVAHDWGGPVGWLVAHHPEAHIRGFMATNGPHPARFADLIANDAEQQAASEYMTFFRSDTAELILTPDYIVKNFFDFLSPADEVIYLEALSQPGAITGGLNWYRANDIGVASTAKVMADVSPTVDVPVSVLWGLDDTAVLPKNAEGLEPYAPDLKVETFAGVDHWIEHRIPTEVADAIRALDARITSK